MSEQQKSGTGTQLDEPERLFLQNLSELQQAQIGAYKYLSLMWKAVNERLESQLPTTVAKHWSARPYKDRDFRAPETKVHDDSGTYQLVLESSQGVLSDAWVLATDGRGRSDLNGNQVRISFSAKNKNAKADFLRNNDFEALKALPGNKGQGSDAPEYFPETGVNRIFRTHIELGLKSLDHDVNSVYEAILTVVKRVESYFEGRES